MKLSSSWDICVCTELLLSERSLVKGEYWGEIEDVVEGGSILIWEWRG